MPAPVVSTENCFLAWLTKTSIRPVKEVSRGKRQEAWLLKKAMRDILIGKLLELPKEK